MAPTPSLGPREPHVPKEVPIGGDIMSIIVTLAAVTALSAFLSQRLLAVKSWRRLPFVMWIVFAIYIDSYCFVFATALLQQVFGVNTNYNICHGAILLCLVCYVTTKILIYVFLVEKAYIIRSSSVRRMKSKLYLFNMFGMLGGYTVVVILNFVFRIAKIVNGECVIGMQSISMIPLITFDAVVNVYLTFLFLIPLKILLCLHDNLPKRPALTEPVLFSAIVIQWVTSRDGAGSSSQPTSAAAVDGSLHARRPSMAHPLGPIHTPHAPNSPHGTDAEVSLVASATARSSSDSPESELAKIHSGTNGGVVVTTTIHRQSQPNSGFGLEMERKDGNGMRLEDDESVYGYPPRPASFAINHAEIAEPPRTHITGGSNSHHSNHHHTKSLSDG
ncbi:uncharacterized protein NECHADRAFT_75079 [Fusarium vanettenii 77-13-4]|uniref:Uncharacterized protein n=1 Tax=Fusarium vanettenii (strain ATCC MYA-4622 / CBS 123669 / FGSC 9596 / NRRL 45880 / 77-13-4) TaxID=660122 RepID=C7YHT4_FUSV7|nr:uncharacterized protein NECHADRAFT_75079 [Fusarium vanettenii 77-13-4]EEU47966.1 hypothetical protein NECHADRAFT_75079 [Fusarium vanettenii 77-13-4]